MTTDKERMLAEITSQWGIRYGMLDFFAEIDPEALKGAYGQITSDSTEVGLLDRKTKRFLIITAMIGQKAEVHHLQVNMRAAVDAGTTAEEMLEVINILEPWVGFVARNMAMEAWRATFRPDIPTINRVIEAK